MASKQLHIELAIMWACASEETSLRIMMNSKIYS